MKPTEIQEEVIPLVLENKNIVGKSQTGTGKTHAFILPMLEKLDENKNECQAVIVVPTRELGKQIYDEIIKIRFLGRPNFYHYLLCYHKNYLKYYLA